MATETTGAELKAFYKDADAWPTQPGGLEVWHEELMLRVNGVEQPDDFSISENLKDGDQVEITYGYVQSNDDSINETFEAYFERWRKKQTTGYLGVSAPKDKLEAVKAAILAAGGTVL